MSTSTLALGQATYDLLEEIDSLGKLGSQRIVETVRADRRGGLIDGMEIGVREGFAFGGSEGLLGNIQSLNIADASRGLIFNDSDAASKSVVDFYNSNNPPLPLSSAPSDANLNILAHADAAKLSLGFGDNRLNAARDLTNSEVQASDGADTVRIGGRADGSFVSLGAGNDQLTVGRSSEDLDVDTGAGDDSALFLGTLTASGTAPRQFTPVDGKTPSINEGSNLINLGDGNDKALFRGGIQGGSPGTGYEVQLGAGNDSVEFGRGSINSGFVLNTGVGSDNVILGRETINAVIDLGWDNDDGDTPAAGDTVVLGAGALLQSSGIRSGQSNDELRLAGTVIDTSLDLGWGDSFVEVSGVVNMGSIDELGVWDLGDGQDTLVFTGTSDVSSGGSGGYINLGLGGDELRLYGSVSEIEFDLGNDSSVDVIRLGDDIRYSGMVISNFGSKDILWIGDGMYGYEYKFLNEWANEGALADFRFANNVVWSQTDDDGSASQEVMTLDTAQFEDGSLEAISNPNGTDETVITFLDEASDWVKGTITDQDGTDTFIPDSSPISATESTTEPYFPDTSYPHSSS